MHDSSVGAPRERVADGVVQCDGHDSRSPDGEGGPRWRSRRSCRLRLVVGLIAGAAETGKAGIEREGLSELDECDHALIELPRVLARLQHARRHVRWPTGAIVV